MDERAPYELTIAGRPGPRILTALPGFEVSACEGGDTRLRGWLQDQAALQGLVRSLGDLGVIIVALRRLDPST